MLRLLTVCYISAVAGGQIRTVARRLIKELR